MEYGSPESINFKTDLAIIIDLNDDAKRSRPCLPL